MAYLIEELIETHSSQFFKILEGLQAETFSWAAPQSIPQRDKTRGSQVFSAKLLCMTLLFNFDIIFSMKGPSERLTAIIKYDFIHLNAL